MPLRLAFENVVNSISATASLVFGFVMGIPAMFLAIVQGEWVVMGISIAGAWLAFLHGCRKYPIQDVVDNANKERDAARRESREMAERNVKLSEENERLRVRLAHLEEDSKTVKIPNPPPQK